MGNVISDATRKSYEAYTNQLKKWASKNGLEIKEETIVRYCNLLLEGSVGLKKKTKQQITLRIRAYQICGITLCDKDKILSKLTID